MVRVEGFEKTQDSDVVTNDDEVGAKYFSTLGVPIVLGREITAQDITTRAHVAVVNEAFAQFYFRNRNPIGGRIAMVDSDHPDEPPFVIVGVAKNVRDHGVRAVVPRRMYAPLTSATFDYPGALNFEVRAAGSPASIVAAVHAQLHRQHPNLVIDSVTTAGELVGDTLTTQALVADLSFCFGALVLALICVGLYGTMSYSVAARTREIGLRMALGAPRSDVVWMIAREATVMLAAGAAVGLPASVAAARLFKTMLFGVGQADAVSMAGAVATLVAIAIVATLVPARRATRVDPMVALRCD
jgi:ABC-type antimicrobial peptide transport system permease subunit